MLFVSTQPVQVEVLDDRKVIVLTNTKIMFSHLDFIEQYLAMPLINSRPSKMYYEPSVMQTMVISDRTIQVYYTDWKTQIKLIRVLILNNQKVDAICYEKQTGWHVFGSMAQYEPTRISFHKSSDKQENILAKCYVEKNKYVLTQEKLEKRQGLTQIKQVSWKDRMMVLRNCNFKISMRGAQTVDKKRDIICINETYILLIYKFEVITMVVEPCTIYFTNSLLISNISKGNMTTIQKYESNGFVQLGTINKEQGNLCAAYLYQNDLTMLRYEQKEIHIRSIPLVNEATQNNPVAKKTSKRKLFQSISRIMQQSHEEGSQLISKQDHQNIVRLPNHDLSQKTETQYFPNQKPKIRDIVINDQQIKSNPLNESASQVLSRSGIQFEKNSQEDDSEIQQQVQQAQLSFELANKVRENKARKNSANFKSVPHKVKNQVGHFRSESLKDNKNDRGQNFTKSQKLRQKKQDSNSVHNVSVQKSEDSRSGKRISSKYSRPKKNDSFLNNSNQNQNNSFEQHAETPAFGFEGFGNDKWGQFDRQWDEAAQNQINQEQQDEMQESICVTDQKSILKLIPEKASKKFDFFKPPNAIPTSELYHKIEKSSYCSLISKMVEQNSNKLEQCLDIFLLNVLDQPEAQLFFEKNIRTFSPQYTQDKIRNLFKSVLNNQQLKQKMTSALQLFKISEVPKQILCFPSDFIKIVTIVCKQIYIQDLLRPSQNTIDYILTAYFDIQNFSQEIVKIQDQQIDISHPRNMLNILLYLNQFLLLKIQIIIKVYCSKLLEQDHLDILKKIVEKQNIFQICEVPRSVLDDVIIERFRQLLNQSVENADYLWAVIEFLSPSLINQYRIKLAIINQFNKCNIIFDLQALLSVKQTQVNIYLFLQKIITENSCRNLIPLKISSIYRSLYWLQQGQRIKNVTFQYIQIVKILAEKFCEKKMFYYGFILLDSIVAKVKISFIAKMLMNYLNCRFINRLAERKHIESLESVFPELMSNPDLDCTVLQADKIKIPQFSNSLSCSWNKFVSIFQKYLVQPMQIKLLTFCQINIAQQLFLTLDQNLKQKFSKFVNEIEENIIVQIDNINQNDQSLNPKGQTSLLFEDHPREEAESLAATSTINRDDMLLNVEQEKKKSLVYKSMTLIDHFNDINQQKLLRRNSDKKYSSESILNGNEDLLRVKLLVSQKQIIDELRDIYYNRDQDIFIKSLKLVDLEKVQLSHLDIFKSIVYKNIDFSLSKILPFDIFLVNSAVEAFQLAKQKIIAQINIRNFWVIFTIMQLMFKKGCQVGIIFLNKCINYFRTDSYVSMLKSMLEITKLQIDNQVLENLIQQAKCYKLQKTCKFLEDLRRNSI